MGLLEILLIVVLICWIGGFSMHLGGDFIHILLIVFVIVLVYRLLQNRNPPAL